jgi:flagellar biosynthesis component FlhA
MPNLTIAMLATVILVSASSTSAQESTRSTPTKVALENDKVRVNETWSKPGEKNSMMARSDRVIVQLNAGKQRFLCKDGKTEELEFKAGSVNFRKADNCQNENIGKTDTHSFVITIK